jgi:PleD family two-component response regulator
LLASPDEVFTRSLESVLAPAGYAVLRAYTARSAFEQERRARPDAVILAKDLLDPEGIAVCRALRQDGRVSASTPIFLTQSTPATRPQRLEALRAGADELWGQPLDIEEFALRLAAQLRAKFDADRARNDGLVDPRTGFWNGPGIARRAGELLALMVRDHTSIAAAAIAPADPTLNSWETGDRMAAALRRTARSSDAVGRVDTARFVVIAPRTGAAAGEQLRARLAEGLDDARIRYVAFDDAATAPDAETLIARAMAALHVDQEHA